MKDAKDVNSLFFTIAWVLVLAVGLFALIEIGNGAGWLVNWEARADEAEARKVEAYSNLTKAKADAEITRAAARAVRRDTDLATFHAVEGSFWNALQSVLNYVLIALVLYLWRRDKRKDVAGEEV